MVVGEKRVKRKRRRVREKSVRAVILTEEEAFRTSMEHGVGRNLMISDDGAAGERRRNWLSQKQK